MASSSSAEQLIGPSFRDVWPARRVATRRRRHDTAIAFRHASCCPFVFLGHVDIKAVPGAERVGLYSICFVYLIVSRASYRRILRVCGRIRSLWRDDGAAVVRANGVGREEEPRLRHSSFPNPDKPASPILLGRRGLHLSHFSPHVCGLGEAHIPLFARAIRRHSCRATMTSVSVPHAPESSATRARLVKEAQPDQQWKNDTRKRIEHTLQSMVDEAQKVRAAAWREHADGDSRARATLDYEERMTNIRGLAQEEFMRQLNLEVQERVWAHGQIAGQSKDLVEQQQAILDSIQKDEASRQSATSQPVASSSKASADPTPTLTTQTRASANPLRWIPAAATRPRTSSITPKRRISMNHPRNAHETIITFENTSENTSEDDSDDSDSDSIRRDAPQSLKKAQEWEYSLSGREQKARRAEEEATRLLEQARKQEAAARELEEAVRSRERAIDQKTSEFKRQEVELKRRESELRMKEIRAQRQAEDLANWEAQAAAREARLKQREDEMRQREEDTVQRIEEPKQREAAPPSEIRPQPSLDKGKGKAKEEFRDEQKWKAAEDHTQKAADSVWQRVSAEQRRDVGPGQGSRAMPQAVQPHGSERARGERPQNQRRATDATANLMTGSSMASSTASKGVLPRSLGSSLFRIS
ncbi:hypothetical protein FA95DRAFT_272820 [Auriscalpium vulgare]|uniref:Uncharacterized protein n=1 Tax=Auriscalpium vulgare TaxID=40419 RepID=A0ACB8S5J9_9AGAM|nr:hypothetical protein FA95DRAFT_272820 [Auriscalpium vulgare]